MVCCDTVRIFGYFLWRFGGLPIGFENDWSKPLKYTRFYGNNEYKVYSVINDKRISKVKIFANHGKAYSLTRFYDGIFVLLWNEDGDGGGGGDSYVQGLEKITAYDGDWKVVYNEVLLL
jgi:hypothetical protein